MRQQRGGEAQIRTKPCLRKRKHLLQPSARSDVPPFMVMDVMAAAARLEAQGRRIIHMEVGQPAAGAPATARRRGAGRAVSAGRSAIPRRSACRRCARRIARAYKELARPRHRSRPYRRYHRLVRRASCWRSLRPSKRATASRSALPGYPPYRHILTALGCEPVGIEIGADDALVDDRRDPARRPSRSVPSKA